MSLSKPLAALAAVLVLLLVAAPSASAAGACSSAAHASPSKAKASKRALVRATLCVLNAHRTRNNLRPLRLSPRLSRAARRHSRAMARRNFFSHDSLTGASFVDRIRRAGYLRGARSWSVGENIAYGSGRRSTPASIGRAWMNSAGHRANILSRSYRAIGIGIAPGTPGSGDGGTYVTDFGRRS